MKNKAMSLGAGTLTFHPADGGPAIGPFHTGCGLVQGEMEKIMAFNRARFSDGGTVDDHRFGKKASPDYREAPASNALSSTPGYERLVAVYSAAHDQAAKGKGFDRHANGLPFHEQRMQQISRLFDSPVGMAYQVAKKVAEGLALPTHERQLAELYGALNYLAGIVIFLEDANEIKLATPKSLEV